MALEPANSEPIAAVKRVRYCLTVTCGMIADVACDGWEGFTGNYASSLAEIMYNAFQLGKMMQHASIQTAVAKAGGPTIKQARMWRSYTRRFATAATRPAPAKKHKKTNQFAKIGLPLVLFIVGGFVGLTQFVGGKYEARDHAIKSQSMRSFNLDEEHKKMTQKLLLDDFELKPVPKPKEE